MARTLVVVAGTGLMVSAVCLLLARVINPAGQYGWSGPSGWWDGGETFTESGELASRDFAWSGGDGVEVAIPGTVNYAPAPDWKITATGRASALDRLRIDAGRIWFSGSPASSSIEVRIEGPLLTRFVLNGEGDLILDNIAQQELDIVIRGSGSVRGHGNVGRLDLTIVGSGDAELANVLTGDANVSIVGSGDAEVAPRGNAEITTVGSGDVRLRARPKHLSTHTVGSGSIVPMGGDEAVPRGL